MIKKINIIFLWMACVGCAPVYKAPASSALSDLNILAHVDASGTTSRSIISFVVDVRHDDNSTECQPHPHGERLVSEFENGSPELINTDTVKIEAGRPFWFQVHYLDSRYAQNVGCAVLASFNPELGHDYQAVLNVTDDAFGCDFAVFDITNNSHIEMPVIIPKYRCPLVKHQVLNGARAKTDWETTYQPGVDGQMGKIILKSKN